ncbi:MAG: hypothetical protein KIT13_01180 [Burkholderiales bacterium]|nr:hypothetical protein [Burkholderiales bacterium]MCW5604954.1 hypothetical protein [Burkholderiales bacterium]
MAAEERALAVVPRGTWWLLAAALAMQLCWHALSPPPDARAEALPAPPQVGALRAASLGEPVAAAQLLLLYLQAFDNQPGVSIPFAELDYRRVTAWLDAALRLDAHTGYPLLMASQLYGQVPDAGKQRAMCDFVQARFLEAPDLRWRWLAHCAIMAKHRLHDPALALRYAADITRHAGGASGWARQMQVFILEDLGETDSARILLGGLLANDEITDPAELHFLTERLKALESAEKPSKPSKSRQ